jgi:hypothetical protein
MDSTLDLLQKATLKLSQGGSLKERLADAYACHLIGIDVEELPEGVRTEFGNLSAAMSREQPLPRESAIRASVRKMSNEEAGHYAALVVRVFAALARVDAANHLRRTPRAVPNAPLMQLLAADA